VLLAPELEAGAVLLGVGTAESVGFGVGPVVGDTALGVGATGTEVVGPAGGIRICGDLLTLDGFLADGEHVVVGVEVAVGPFPFPAGPVLEPVRLGAG
jgi:hypothetical protein